MSDAEFTVLPASPRIEVSPAISTSERRIRWFEVCLVLAVAFGGYLVNSLYLLMNGPGASPPISGARWGAGLVQESASLLLVGYVLRRRGLRFANLGLRWSIKDLGFGILITVLSYVVYVGGWFFMQLIHHSAYGSFAHGPTGKDFFAHPGWVAIPFSLLNPFFEELIVRAYLMTEVLELTGSSFLAVALSVLVQFSYHLYYGWTTALSMSFLFLTFAVYYLLSRRAVPIIFAHAFFDLSALIRLW